MMRIFYCILMLPAILSCAGMAVIRPVTGAERDAIIEKSQAPFLKQRWRLVHSITGTLPGGDTASMIGISLASPERRAVHCILMSIEGFVFLDAEFDGALVLNRGIGPFQSEDLVAGIIRDISLMLFKPAGEIIEVGVTQDGRSVCRYRSNNNSSDVIVDTDGSIELHVYDESQNLTRSIQYSKFRPDCIPGKIEHTGYGLFRYSLELDLLEADALP